MPKLNRRYTWSGQPVDLRAEQSGDTLSLDLGGRTAVFTIVPGASGAFVLQEGDRIRTGHAVARDGSVWVQVGGRTWVLEAETPSRGRSAAGAAASDRIVSPMVGTVRKIFVSSGDAVESGAPVLIVEAMKMEFTVAAPADGTVRELLCRAGQSVDLGELLAEFEPAAGPSAP